MNARPHISKCNHRSHSCIVVKTVNGYTKTSAITLYKSVDVDYPHTNSLYIITQLIKISVLILLTDFKQKPPRTYII